MTNTANVKKLFKALAPYSDDVAKGMSKYGDDALRAINTGNVREVAKDLMSVADDVGSVSLYNNPNALNTLAFVENSHADALQNIMRNANDVEAAEDVLLQPFMNSRKKALIANERAGKLAGLGVSPQVSKVGDSIISDGLSNSGLSKAYDDLLETPYATAGGGTVMRYGPNPIDFEYASPLEVIGGDVSGRAYQVENNPKWALRKEGNYEFPVPVVDDSYLQLDPDAYKSGISWEPNFDDTDVRPEMFPGYSSELVDSFIYPDGFYDPDGAAMYYDSLERGYTPDEYDGVDYYTYNSPAYRPVHGQVRKRVTDNVLTPITSLTHSPAKLSMDVDDPKHRDILERYYRFLSNSPRDRTPNGPVFISDYADKYHYPWEYGY